MFQKGGAAIGRKLLMARPDDGLASAFQNQLVLNLAAIYKRARVRVLVTKLLVALQPVIDHELAPLAAPSCNLINSCLQFVPDTLRVGLRVEEPSGFPSAGGR